MSLLPYPPKDSSDAPIWKTVLWTVLADATARGAFAASKDKSQANLAARIDGVEEEDSDDEQSEQGESDGYRSEEDAEDGEETEEENKKDASGRGEKDKEGEAGGGPKSVESVPMFHHKRVFLFSVGNYSAVRSVLEKQGATVMTHHLSCMYVPTLVNALTHFYELRASCMQDDRSVMHVDALLVV